MQRSRIHQARTKPNAAPRARLAGRRERVRPARLRELLVFARKQGLSWVTGAGVRTETALADWVGERGAKGRLAPKGFPRSNRF